MIRWAFVPLAPQVRAALSVLRMHRHMSRVIRRNHWLLRTITRCGQFALFYCVGRGAIEHCGLKMRSVKGFREFFAAPCIRMLVRPQISRLTATSKFCAGLLPPPLPRLADLPSVTSPM